MQELSNFFSGCRAPIKIYSKQKQEYVTVSCGTCPDCINRKLSNYNLRSYQESLNCNHITFITLTYNYANMPVVKVEYNEKEDYLSYIDYTARRLHPRNKKSIIKKSCNYGKQIAKIHHPNMSLFRLFYQKKYKKSRIFKEKPYPHLYYLCKEDLQKFIKRLRFYFMQDFNQSFRYFAVGEYTPQHFQPHYHIILYHSCRGAISKLSELVNKCWQYGRTDTQPAYAGRCAGSYLSGYLNSYLKLPYFLSSSQIKPFTVHSKFLGVQNVYAISSAIYSFDRYPFEVINYKADDIDISINLAGKDKHYFFPKCYNYELQTIQGRLRLYSLYDTLSKQYKTTNPSEIIKAIFYRKDVITHMSTLLHLLEIPYDLFHYSKNRFDDLIYSIRHPEVGFKHSLSTSYSRLYNTLLIGKKVYNMCAHLNISMYDFVRKVDKFYNQFSQWKLSEQSKLCEEYNTKVDFDYISPIFNFDYSNKYIKGIHTYKDWQYQQKIKHKELNDANNIFCFT